MKPASLKSAIGFLFFLVFLLFMSNPAGVLSLFSSAADIIIANTAIETASQLKVLVFALIIVIIWVCFHRATKHIRIERQLATSKIGSVTVGLAEIRGHARAIETCLSPWTKTECIAYRYEKKRVTLEDGRVKSVVLDSRTDVMPFHLVDDTGLVLVDVDDLEIIGVPAKSINEPNTDITHKEYILESGFDGLLIGRATPEGGKIVMRKDQNQKVFNMTNYASVLLERRQAPMFRLLGIYSLITLVMLGIIVSV